MDFVSEYAENIGELLTWLSNPNSSIPVVTLLQAIAAVLGATISILGFYKAWRYAESRLGERLKGFLAREEEKLAVARLEVKRMRGERSAVRHARPKLFSNHELRQALRHVRTRRFTSAETLLNDALLRTKEREDLAFGQTELHKKQRAMAHLLLGAIADAKNDHQSALTHFQTAYDIDGNDVEALEYVGMQLMKMGNAAQALLEFVKLKDIAVARGDALLTAHAYRNCGLAHEALAVPSTFNANFAYKDAIEAFPANGPVMEIAYIHELRGNANIKLRYWPLANTSLMQALQRYSQVHLAGNGEKDEAAAGAKRIQEALVTLKNLQNATALTPLVPNGGTTAPAVSAMFSLADQPSTQQAPDSERPA
jgi:tetratricopeptide (TPR) repeat protein